MAPSEMAREKMHFMSKRNVTVEGCADRARETRMLNAQRKSKGRYYVIDEWYVRISYDGLKNTQLQWPASKRAL